MPASNPPDQGSGTLPPRQYHDVTIHLPGIWEAFRLQRDVLTQMVEVLTNLTGKVTVMSQTTSDLDARIAQLQAAVQADTDAVNAATNLLGSIQQMIDNAVADALAKGATQAELQALTDLSTTLQTNTGNLVAAIAANTPHAP